ncbi:hypothetical protein PK35_02865 [Tamlana nanhaiensis]|uniref:histidine kinase n=1 Tax=Neotamlana nanhaiensis TaxID=1382798 RepID=A0A0D7W6G0_9FLAO|nr:two-component regulator propeller domain-containing protein [Tamlana nanhaiensis]KJD34715.1 hypothetical protein PK35_02865 [Tamlana nanhaiensis]
MSFKKAYSSLILVFFYVLAIHGQTSSIKPIQDILNFHLLDVNNGLSNNFVNDIEQDSIGYIWVATTEGLNRFDGTNFVQFKQDFQSNDSILLNNNVSSLKIDNEGNLLIATDDGINIFNPKKESFRTYKQNGVTLKTHVSCMAIGPRKEIIVGSARIKWGLTFIDENNKVKYISTQNKNHSSLSTNYISNLFTQGDSILWIGTNYHGLHKYNYKTNNVKKVALHNNPDNTFTIETIYSDSENNLWFGTSKGLFVITKNADTLSLKKSIIPKKGLSDNEILSFEEDNEKRMWIGTRNGGLNILKTPSFLSKQSLEIEWFLPKNDGSSVYNRTISAIKKDNNGNMWLGTSTGLNFVNPDGEPIKLFVENSKIEDGLNHNRIGALSESKDGKIWVGTDGKGLSVFNPKTGKFKHVANSDKSELSNNYIISLYDDQKENLWIGTYKGGLNKFNTKTGYFEHYLQGSSRDGSDVRKIFEDNQGHIWVGTNRGGLYKYNPINNNFEYIETLGKIDIRDIKNDSLGNLWLASYGDGIIKYNYKKNIAKYYTSNNTKGVITDIIFSIQPLKNGDILAGPRYGGLIRLNPSTNKIQNFTENDGLSNNTIMSIVMGTDTEAWLSTAKGISYYNTETNNIINLNPLNNIQKSDFNIGAALKSKEGLMYFGGNSGFNVFNPKDIFNKNESTESILFQNLYISNKKVTVKPETDKAILKNAITYQDHLSLKHDQNSFSIDFAVLNYPFAKNINYSYILENYHKNWISTKGASVANLSNIPPGNYNLKVKAVLGSGKEIINQIGINIPPPFWRTSTAYTLYTLLILALLYIGLKYYSEHLKLKNSLLFEKKQRQLEQDLNEERIRFFTSFSHELRTPLTLILGPVNDMLTKISSPEHTKTLSLIKKNASTLYSTINKLLEFRKSQVGLSDLMISKNDIANVLKQLVNNYRSLAKKKGITLNLNLETKSLEAWFDLEKVQIIISNLLSNAIKYCDKGSIINVYLRNDQKYFNVVVEDTGMGIHQNDIDYIFDWYYQTKSQHRKKGTGIGLALSKNFAELHEGKITLNSKLNQGTTFTLAIPYNKSSYSKEIINDQDSIIENDNALNELNVWDETLTKANELKNRNINLNKEDRLFLLLIDDNPDVLDYLEGVLKNNYDLIFAENGQEGIDKAIKYVPDLIISDVMMPQKSGIDLCGVLKKETTTTHIPIILLTAKTNAESIKEGYETGADDYIIKPFNSDILFVRIKNLIEGRNLLRKYFLGQDKQPSDLSLEQSKLFEKEKDFLRELELAILNHLKKGGANVNEITKAMGMSRTPLFRKIKAITGKNINEYITMVKLKKAASLIKNEGYSISQAAFEVGYKSPTYFRKLFKKQFGVLPSEYKQ